MTDRQATEGVGRSWKPNRKQRLTCQYKIEYDTYDEAEKEAAYLRRRRGEYVRPYTCSVCNNWHLTRQPIEPVVLWSANHVR